MFLIYDTETTGLPRNYEAPITDLDNWPRLVQLAWQLHDENGELIEAKSFIIRPDNFTIPYHAEKVHGITTQKALKVGSDLKKVLEEFIGAIDNASVIVGHNIEFDLNIIGAEFIRTGLADHFRDKIHIDTSNAATDYCALPGGRGGGFKYPALFELHLKLFDEDFKDAHNAAADVVATARCFFEMIRIGLLTSDKTGMDPQIVKNFVQSHPKPIRPVSIEIVSNFDEETEPETKEEEAGGTIAKPSPARDISGSVFCHLHLHSQYSVLQATPDVKEILAKAVEFKMPAVALTDHGNLFGALNFITEAKEVGIKPIIGCEFYLAIERLRKKFTKENPDIRHQQVLLAKTHEGYKNLSRLSSLGYIEGFYSTMPRIDKELVKQYKEGLIATTGGLQSEIPELILNIGETQAEEAFRWWHELFGEDFYVQLNRHGQEEEKRVNDVLLKLARKYNVKIIAANNVYYINKEDAEGQDILLCIQNAEYQSTPIGYGRGQRFGFPNQEYYFKSQEEMRSLFQDIPEAIDNISHLVNKIDVFDLHQDPLMPDFPLPEGFTDANEYLRHVTLEGAKKRYNEFTQEISDRISFELETIKKMGYPGYFLIIQDMLDHAREMDVSVGPGRGSAAGSVVAYCLRITDIDPLKFNLLFERFLNPDRISLPDIDIDFDEDGRERVLKWVTETYGAGRVAQIITFGKMAPKMAIRDIARVKQLPLNESDRLAKLVPLTPGITFRKAYLESPDLEKERTSGDPLVRETLKSAELLEGTIRNTGTHACGIIIGKDDLIDYIPLSITKESDMLATQYEGGHIEEVGMLKMDFLGLKTLSIIKDTLDNIRHSKGESIDIENIPLDDATTYELFARGDTNGIFQFESDGMKTNLRDLKPNRFEDLIAMNALYRPGPMEYIPNYIRRKHGRERIEYDIPEMEEILKETYGITVYQEQVMLLSQKLAGFSKGEADLLRKGMGKKIKKIIDDLKPKFEEGASQNGHQVELVNKIWQDWESFANYAFNKSHSTCYAIVAYRMAYLKAHYPAEFMAAVLSRNLSDIKKITFFIDECRHLDLSVLGPDINESMQRFTVNRRGEIRFGIAAIKGIGESAVNAIIEERDEHGAYRNIFDFTKRINLRAVNKRGLEVLAMAGAFDCFEGIHRAQYFYRENSDDTIFLEKIIRHASLYQEKQQSSQHSLFGSEISVELPDPAIPECQPWSKNDQLKNEKEVTGFYISGHPLDDHKIEIETFCNVTLEDLHSGLLKYKLKTIVFAGKVNSSEQKTARSGNLFGTFELEDFTDTMRFTLFSEDFLKFKHLLFEGANVLVQARVVQNRINPNRLDIQVNNIMLLAEAMERLAKALNLCISLADLNEELIKELSKIIKNNPGKCDLVLRVKDPEEGYSLEMHPLKHKVNPAGVVRALSHHQNVEFKLNGNARS